jgi:hypothetical protein
MNETEHQPAPTETPPADQPADPPAQTTDTPPADTPPADQPPDTPPAQTTDTPPAQPDPLRDALRQAADAIRQLAIATQTDIVPELVTGDTPDEVRASIERSRAAYRAALAHLARSLPTPPPATTSTDAGPSDPLTLISRGLSRKE